MTGRVRRAVPRTALTVDGFVVKDGQLRLAMPAALGLPAVDDEVHELLKRFGFVTPMGHLEPFREAERIAVPTK